LIHVAYFVGRKKGGNGSLALPCSMRYKVAIMKLQDVFVIS